MTPENRPFEAIAGLARTASHYRETARRLADSRGSQEIYRLLDGEAKDFAAVVGELGELVARWLPDLWPRLRLVRCQVAWHNDPRFDWEAAETELRMIEAAALTHETDEGEASPTTVKEDDLRARLAAAVDEIGLRIVAVAGDSSRTVDEKMRDILEIDRRCVGYDSSRWAALLKVTPSAVRQTVTWREVLHPLKEA